MSRRGCSRISRVPRAQVDELERTVRYPDETDHVINLPISVYGGG